MYQTGNFWKVSSFMVRTPDHSYYTPITF
jgi:hypothetical protein